MHHNWTTLSLIGWKKLVYNKLTRCSATLNHFIWYTLHWLNPRSEQILFFLLQSKILQSILVAGLCNESILCVEQNKFSKSCN